MTLWNKDHNLAAVQCGRGSYVNTIWCHYNHSGLNEMAAIWRQYFHDVFFLFILITTLPSGRHGAKWEKKNCLNVGMQNYSFRNEIWLS